MSQVISALSSTRDSLTNSRLEALLTDLDRESIIKHCGGTISHAAFSGDVLEGLVLVMEDQDGQRRVLKYKFPNYTSRTFALRPLISLYGKNLVNRFCAGKFAEFSYNWCVSPEGNSFWLSFLKACAVSLQRDAVQNIDGSSHIEVADIVGEMSKEEVEDLAKEFDEQAASAKRLNLIVVVGPIGSGKSIFAEKLCSTVPGLQHIDGDAFMDDTISLGMERNPVTMWQITKTFLKGKAMPVISTGGGALCLKAKEVALKKYFWDLFHQDLNVVVCVSSPSSSDITRATSPLCAEALATMYNMEESVMDRIIRDRVKRGAWALPGFEGGDESPARERALKGLVARMHKQSRGRNILSTF